MASRHDVEVRVPADVAFVSVLRTTTAGMAARLDFTLDDIEDLRIAVGEACSMVLAQAGDDADMYCAFDLDPAKLTVIVTADAQQPTDPDHDSFAWQVLTALTTGVTSQVTPESVSVTLTMTPTARD